MEVNGGTKIILHLERTDKKLSNAVFRMKIEFFYEAVVSRKVGPNWHSGSTIKDLSKESQKIHSR